jgi:hypothetical protein
MQIGFLGFPIMSSAMEFGDLERGLLNCHYINFFQRPQLLEKGFQVPDEDLCENYLRRAQQKTDLEKSPQKRDQFSEIFPTYSAVLRDLGVNSSEMLRSTNLLGPVHQQKAEKPFRVAALSINPAQVEDSLRSKLISQEDKNSCADARILAQQMKSERFNQLKWKQLLHSRGFHCTVKVFKDVHQSLNQARRTAHLQQNLTDKLATNQKADLTGMKVLYFPNLGYDLPTLPWEAERELLSPDELAQGLKSLGATVHVIDRVTVEPVQQQITQSEKMVLQILNMNPKTKFVFYGRSMGGLIAREILQRNPGIHKQVQGLLLGGATPYGSVIADYKSRADVFHEIYKQSQNLISSLVATSVAIFDSRLLRVLGASSRRLNLEQMSHRKFQPSIQNFAFPVINLVFLPDSLEEFFKKSPRSQNVDFVFLQMAMYGPTEGSAPIAHAIVESKQSSSIFLPQYNHLAFWEMSEAEALKLTSSALSLLD